MKFSTLKKISYAILFLALLNVFSFMVMHVSQGGNRLGFLTRPLQAFAEFPRTVANAFVEIKSSDIYLEKEAIEEVNTLSYDLYALNGFYESSQWHIRLTNLKNDKTVHEWLLNSGDYNKTDREFSHSEPRGPIILEDMSLITTCDESYNLYRLDKDSKVIWHNTDYQFHHAINTSVDGNIWTCTREMVKSDESNFEYWDNAITKIDINTGKTLYTKSITELLFEHGHQYMIHGIGNAVSTGYGDPLHLNDIEPVLTDGPYWKKGDVFLSFRHRSLILLYRPSTNEILRFIQGPFYNQHDIDIQSDSTISIFNNNISSMREVNPYVGGKPLKDDAYSINQYAEVLTYNFKDGSYTSMMPERFKSEMLFTPTQGLHHVLENGDLFIECQNKGTIYLFDKEKTLIRKYYNESADDAVQRPHWIRIYESLNF